MFKRICASLLLLAASGAVNAAVITDSISGTVSTGVFDPPATALDSYQQVLIPQFDSSLGTLTSVELAFTGNTFGEITLSNDSDPGTGDATVSARVSFRFSLWSSDIGNTASSTSPNLILFTLDGVSDFGTFIGGWEGSASLAPGASQTFGDMTQASEVSTGVLSTDSVVFDASNSFGGYTLADFVGTGDVDLFIASLVEITTSGSGDGSTTQSFDSLAEVEYIYTFENEVVSVSAPSIIALLGLGLAFVGVRGRKN